MAFSIIILLCFYLVTFCFNNLKWTVRNYKSREVPYSIGAILMIFLFVDYLFFKTLYQTGWNMVYLFLVWGLGLIDDVYGNPLPKGIKGHFGLFFTEKKCTTGLVKALGITLGALVYAIVHTGHFPYYSVALLIFIPHSMNLLDTKPLRVWKTAFVLLFVPLIVLNASFLSIFVTILLFLLWAIYESAMKGMLGDNGAMLIGAWVALVSLQSESMIYQITVLLFSVFITWIAERKSIQEWVERTPIIRTFDQWGRVE
ncbi:hypothetical protein [Evansella tamaricis]|uniref:Uncharacterized protein n=1 Tax=Evansella tamaricis TaxID=2069301 RepID=A0ABS6JMU5_9BACI|nr:hypothetical protein [Evansella tamaricis]MBU9714690.1 hypothetical protein [Evansella tamaricis]